MYKNSTVVPQTEQTTNLKVEAQGPKKGGDCTWTLLPCHTRGNCTSVIRPACALAVHRNTVRQENSCKWGELCPIRSRRSAESPLHSRRQSHGQCTREVALSPNSIAASDLLAIVASARTHVRRDGRSRRCDGHRQLERCRRGSPAQPGGIAALRSGNPSNHPQRGLRSPKEHNSPRTHHRIRQTPATETHSERTRRKRIIRENLPEPELSKLGVNCGRHRFVHRTPQASAHV